MDVLLTETAYAAFADDLRAVDPGLGLLTMDRDGTIRRDAGGDPIDWDDARPEVIWSTYDLFPDEGVRRFYGFTSRCGSVRWFASAAAGFETPFYAGLLERGVRLTTGHGTRVAIAEFVLRAVLDAFQGAATWRTLQAEGRWARAPFSFREVDGSSWLVWGLGHIGAEVAVRARALGAEVVGVRRNPRGDEPVDVLCSPAEGTARIGAADVVVLTAASNTSTARLVDAAFLAAMKPDAVLVNIARGDLVDEDALVAALDAGRPGTAVLDVFATEPLPADSPLWRHPRVVVSPHQAGASRDANRRYAPDFVANLRRYLDGVPLADERTLSDL